MTESLSGDSPASSADHSVGLVVVSHSRVLARSAVALAAVVTLATLAGLNGLAQADSSAQLARATAAATRG